jgi:poly-gamma-glutamate capsule biosynthesis protein CapA/YwtB (metallophosphatase superfamily)
MSTSQPGRLITVFLGGDVMTGRGVDQILPYPGDPRLREPYVQDARTYVELAERANGPIPRPVEFGWPWGDALAVLDRTEPDVRLINLETGITRGGRSDRGKAVHYRMSPENLPCLTAIRPDVCALANNHVLDWGREGLEDTLDSVAAAGIGGAGAGRSAREAVQPVIAPLEQGGRVVVFAFGTTSSGILPAWAATPDRPGVALLPDLSAATADEVIAGIRRAKEPGDVVVVSLHWGTNWGYEIPETHIRFARRVIDGGADIVHGHSSHHPRSIEVYRGKLILYGCGDLVDDYEGIRGHEPYRDDLRLLYFATVESGTGGLHRLRMTPMRARRIRLHHATPDDAGQLRDVLDQISRPFGTHVDLAGDGTLELCSVRSGTTSATHRGGFETD